jgi:hypothetical protein
LAANAMRSANPTSTVEINRLAYETLATENSFILKIAGQAAWSASRD